MWLRAGWLVVVFFFASALAAEGAIDRPVGPHPGAVAYPADLAARVRAAVLAKGDDYQPRTHHLRKDGWPKFTNRLILEGSPYLLQHAHNPVNWYPWGDEAFTRARREGKPVLLSVGYSTCHWCHVMEEESFEDLEVARYLNENYIAVKVDRERRPDVDGVYMTAVRVMSRRGGWPMTVWLTPDREPFFGGTYFPARDGDRGTRTGFLTLLKQLKQRYDQNPEDVLRSAADIRRRVAASMAPARGTGLPTAAVLTRALQAESAAFDPRFGGFGGAPKFPRSTRLDFLLRQHARSGDQAALGMVRKTLDAMAAGGMYDQIGGGFHRYSTDARWLVPHFEKMLYDNGQLAVSYLEAYQATADPSYARVCRDILDYVEREMTSPGGAFYSATDADSEGEEGTFFVWTPEQIRSLLDVEEARVALAYYAVSPRGNFEGKSILHTPRSAQQVADELAIPHERFSDLLGRARRKLYDARSRRIPPLRDEKILPSWNGLMISAFARAGFVLDEPRYTLSAERAADFLLSRMRGGERLRRTWLAGASGGDGFLDDYAFVVAALLDLYEASFDARWLREAIALQSVLDRKFWDEAAGGYFLTPSDGELLLAREKPSYDGAEPSGNSVALSNLLRFYELTTDDRYRERAEELLRAFENVWTRGPTSVPRMLSAIDFWLDGAKEIVLVVPEDLRQADPFLTQLRASFVPNRVLTVVREEDSAALAETVPLVRGKRARSGKATAYVCKRQVCDLPTTDPQIFAGQLERREKSTAAQ